MPAWSRWRWFRVPRARQTRLPSFVEMPRPGSTVAAGAFRARKAVRDAGHGGKRILRAGSGQGFALSCAMPWRRKPASRLRGEYLFERQSGTAVQSQPPIPKEVLMRILALAILTIGTVSIGPAAAQTYDPAYPVCLRWAYSYECSYTSLPQCNASASGRAAQCFINPYFASAEEPAGYRRHRHRVY